MTGLIAFGDSYLDSGMGLTVSEVAVANGVPNARILPAPVSDPIYAAGRWSNGPSMIEVMAKEIKVDYSNFAVGGAKATSGNYHAWLDYCANTGLSGQLDSFETLLGGRAAPADAIYVVSAGANDYFQFHDFSQPGLLSPTPHPRLSYAAIGVRTANAVIKTIHRLRDLGARRVIFLSSYALELMPWVSRVSPQVEQATSFMNGFNETLRGTLARETASGGEIVEFDVGTAMRTLATSGVDHGILNVGDACQPLIPTRGLLQGDAANYYWWDECHPTARVHQLLGLELARFSRNPA